MLKCLKPICYEINCSDNDIINSIMESSCFYGEFLNNSFKMQLLSCLLYTSDAADDLLCVDLGGRRIIKKKKEKEESEKKLEKDNNQEQCVETQRREAEDRRGVQNKSQSN